MYLYIFEDKPASDFTYFQVTTIKYKQTYIKTVPLLYNLENYFAH